MTTYLDNAATSFPKPEAVYQTLDRFARSSLANPGRAGHKMALAAEHALDDGRHRLNRFFNGKAPERFVFTLNCTDALNMAFKGVLQAGDHVITSDLEHNSVSRPLRAMELANFITLTRLKADCGGTLRSGSNSQGNHAEDADDRDRTRQQRDRQRATDCRDRPHRPRTRRALPGRLRLRRPACCRSMCRRLNIDLLAFPGHKGLFGPTGTGALYVAPRVNVKVWREGGTGGDSSSETQPKELPYFLEGGTPNVLGVAGLAAGIQWVESEGIDKIRTHEVGLIERLWWKLDEIGGLDVFGHRDPSRHVGTLSFRSEALAASDIGGILDQAFDIAIRPGLHCAPYTHRALGTFPDGTVRVSPGPFNTEADIDRLVVALHARS